MLDRRGFLANSLAAASVIAASSRLTGASESRLTPIVRKDVRDLSADEVRKYKLAVQRMRELSNERPQWDGDERRMPSVPTDKRSYTFQALLHTNHCPHGNWWFFPWHRVYIFYFEAILRELVKDDLDGVPLAIPYWNWIEQREIPEIFREGGRANPLFDDRRFDPPLEDEDVGPDVIRNTLDEAHAFSAFGSQPRCTKRAGNGGSPFEDGPHGIVHVKVGWFDNSPSGQWPWGRPGTLTSPPTAAFDPIFWSHHANIDRLWDVWLAQEGHANPSFDAPCRATSPPVTWGSLRFTEFVNEQGEGMDRTVQDFLSDEQLRSVVYQNRNGERVSAKTSEEPMADDAESQDDSKIEVKAERIGDEPQALSLTKPVTLSVPATRELQERLASFKESESPEASVIFRLQNLVVPQATPAVRVRGFLNKPDATAETSIKDAHYIGYFTFFSTDHKHGDEHDRHGFGTVLNLAPALTKLREKLDPAMPLTVTLVMLPLGTKEDRPAPERFSIPFERATLEFAR